MGGIFKKKDKDRGGGGQNVLLTLLPCTGFMREGAEGGHFNYVSFLFSLSGLNLFRRGDFFCKDFHFLLLYLKHFWRTFF